MSQIYEFSLINSSLIFIYFIIKNYYKNYLIDYKITGNNERGKEK